MTFPRRSMLVASIVVFVSCSMYSSAQEVGEQPAPVEFIDVDEIADPVNAISNLNTASQNQRQPISKAELDAAYGSEALSIVNEQLRQEVELLAREYRESERRNEIQLFGLGAVVALIFLGIGFVIGKRFGGRRLL
ncbi:MAG: hypothetical protein OXG15_16430 [Gammaproteobacteria bacterium]|nr:hypothetical protein [Gammaproteobacteria bacterium]